MYIYLCLIVCLLVPIAASAIEWDPYKELSTPLNLAELKLGESRMFSGTDPGGTNVDSGNFVRIEPQGASFREGDWVLAEMKGPGAITRIWVTGKDANDRGPRICGRIKIFIDSKDKPAVDLAVEDFFGKAAPFVPPLATPTSGGWINYVPIPFQRYCKVVITDHKNNYAHRVNGLKQTIPHLYHHINWRKLPEGVVVTPFRLPLPAKRAALLQKASAELNKKAEIPHPNDFVLMPGESKSIADFKGSGIIQSLAIVGELTEDIWIRMTWDGASNPAVHAPARLFFASPEGSGSFDSIAFVFKPAGHDGQAHICRLPMPFSKGAKIELINKGSKMAKVLAGFEVKRSRNSGRLLRLHARHINETVGSGDPDYLLASTKKGPGQFIGCALKLPNEFLEGNEKLSIEGRKPAWTGTGTEDYFNGGWYFCFGPYDHAFSGCTYKGEYVTSYRFQVLDALPYVKSFKASLEHGGANDVGGKALGVAYWYQAP